MDDQDLRKYPPNGAEIPTMMKWIRRNYRWVFSGVGVLVLTVFIGALGRWLTPKERDVANAPVAEYGKSSDIHEQVGLRRHTLRKTVIAGDYVDFSVDRFALRVTVQRIANEQVGAMRLPGAAGSLEPIAQLYVDLGGAIIRGGTHCIEVATNTFVVPQVGAAHDEDVASLATFRNTSKFSSFVRVAAEHINVGAQTVEISIVLIK